MTMIPMAPAKRRAKRGAEITPDIAPGVVSLPHGWGHGRPGTRLDVANAHPGVSFNTLAPGDFVDVPSGNAAVNGIPVTVVAC